MDIGTAERPADGETVCGDAHLILERKPRTLILVADGLGHGPHAALAASTLCKYVEEHVEEPLEMLLRGADRAVASTRGAAVMLARVDAQTATLDVAGVGNVALRSWSKEKIQPLPARGVLGRGIRHVRIFRYGLVHGDMFALYTDGISGSFDIEQVKHQSATMIARSVLEGYRKSHDDATCVVVRYLDR
ncbi:MULTISPECIES: SpoIIE family protein phosphatase [Polyangium]|uniref:Phosphoserine phosphatase n=2 Tax=Polyangium TaxID=55 RepID=A0A4U1J5N1_9BACT|nr:MULTISPECIES: SpoIIE family protein phosphatase [Polyangium]MDI1433101.1 SpoIIE family protein phosphatase [Polyangium sorediatum]TKD02063.1 phosphoserine phosphatase [Polyangium fumosum]